MLKKRELNINTLIRVTHKNKNMKRIWLLSNFDKRVSRWSLLPHLRKIVLSINSLKWECPTIVSERQIDPNPTGLIIFSLCPKPYVHGQAKKIDLNNQRPTWHFNSQFLHTKLNFTIKFHKNYKSSLAILLNLTYQILQS